MSSSEEELAALLAEDEAVAKAATPGPWGTIGGSVAQTEAGHLIGDMCSCGDHPDRTEEDAAHIARHDPARVLRFVEAGRAILAECETGGGNTWSPDYYAGLGFAIIALAEAYRD